MATMSDDDVVDRHEDEFDDDSPAQTLAMAVEGQDLLVALVCAYRSKLRAECFSEEAVESMVVSYHHSML